jgi:hypothetical protein
VIPAKITDVYFKARGPVRDVFLRPNAELERLPQVWKNASGARVAYDDIRASFESGEVPGLPTDEVSLIVVTEAGERSCEISLNTVLKLVQDKK